MSYKLPQISDVTFRVICEPEDIPVRGNAMASGDDAADRECEDEIIRRLERGDIWAWCSVTVRAEYRGFLGTDHLGACSYASEKDFREPGGYFDDMCREAFDQLIANMKDAAERLGCDDTDEQCDQWGRPV